jgi:hypothetical protein
MTDQHFITPPFEVVRKWCTHSDEHETYDQFWYHIAAKAAQWGANQEFEACCEWFQEEYKTESWVTGDLKRLRAARRLKPPSLKEQALAALNVIEDKMLGPTTEEILIRSALEALPND